jgi:hypothetical protein
MVKFRCISFTKLFSVNEFKIFCGLTNENSSELLRGKIWLFMRKIDQPDHEIPCFDEKTKEKEKEK